MAPTSYPLPAIGSHRQPSVAWIRQPRQRVRRGHGHTSRAGPGSRRLALRLGRPVLGHGHPVSAARVGRRRTDGALCRRPPTSVGPRRARRRDGPHGDPGVVVVGAIRHAPRQSATDQRTGERWRHTRAHPRRGPLPRGPRHVGRMDPLRNCGQRAVRRSGRFDAVCLRPSVRRSGRAGRRRRVTPRPVPRRRRPAQPPVRTARQVPGRSRRSRR